MAGMTISIMGCGWLGMPLAIDLAQRGHSVKGSTRSLEKLNVLRNLGVEAHQIVFDPWIRGAQIQEFLRSDVLFLNIPPGRKRPDVDLFYRDLVDSLLRELRFARVSFLIFASSTSVYANINQTVVESDAGQFIPPTRSGMALLEAEERLQHDTHFDTTLLRFAGLYGYDRKPGRFLAGRTGLKNPDAPVNLVHRDDCVAILTQVIESGIRQEVFNVCSDEHPTRQELYTAAARKLGLDPPSFEESGRLSYKIVSNAKLKRRLNYQFEFPNPMDEAP